MFHRRVLKERYLFVVDKVVGHAEYLRIPGSIVDVIQRQLSHDDQRNSFNKVWTGVPGFVS